EPTPALRFKADNGFLAWAGRSGKGFAFSRCVVPGPAELGSLLSRCVASTVSMQCRCSFMTPRTRNLLSGSPYGPFRWIAHLGAALPGTPHAPAAATAISARHSQICEAAPGPLGRPDWRRDG